MAIRLDQSTSRPPPSSPSLLALLELVPPSPILSTGDLITSLSSGEIPIYFHDDDTRTSVMDSLCLPDRLSPLKVAPRAQEVNFSKTTFQFSDSDPNGYLENPEAAAANERLISKVDISGPFNCSTDAGNLVLLRWSSYTASGEFVEDRTLLQRTDGMHVAQTCFTSQTSTDPSVVFKEETLPIRPLRQENLSQAGATLSSQVIDVGSEPLTAEGNLKKGDIPSAPRGTESISYKESSNLANERRSEIDKIDPNQSREKATSSVNPTTSLPLNLPQYPYPQDCVPHILTNGQSQETVSLVGNFNPGVDTLNLDVITPLVRNVVKDQQLTSWLRNTTITLSIDQEGFRTVRPTFKPLGITRQRLPGFENAEIDLVAFAPTDGYRFPFRYTLLDNPPALRRLTVNDDGTRDYLSRQASLNVGSSGLYSVRGVESASSTSSLSMSTGSSRPAGLTKLFWQFDYSVEDRKSDQSGRVQDGERTLIPLMFLCSSQLLHPSQGKKIKFTHIVMKTVTTKLIAEKTESLTVQPQIPASKTVSEPGRTTLRDRTSSFSIKSLTWNLHRGTQSNSREGLDMSGKMLRNRNSIGSALRDSFVLRRRRRASSTGYNLTEFAATRQFDEESTPVKHTLSFSQFRQLFKERSGEEC